MADAAEDIVVLARRWLSTSTSGTLCTLSTAAQLEGFPFGSIVPYALDERGRPLLLLASIAEHTKNVRRDARVSLFVSDAEARGDPQASWRMNVAGTLTRLRFQEQKSTQEQEEVVSDDDHATLVRRYVEVVPAASTYAATHDFSFFRLEPLRARVIAGFGRIHWIDGPLLLTPA